MPASRLIHMQWISAVQRPFWAVLLAVGLVGGLLMSIQMALSAPLTPSPAGLLRVALGLTPELLGIGGPVAALLGSTIAAQRWRERGDLRALKVAGVGFHALMNASLAWGMVVAMGVLVCSHWWGPAGRQSARAVIATSLESAVLAPGASVQLGNTWLSVPPDDGGEGGVVLASDDWVALAAEGRIASGRVHLTRGQARALDGRWRLSFDEAHWPIEGWSRRRHNFERTTPELWGFIQAQRSKGLSSARAEVTLMKRTTLALGIPLVSMLGLCLGGTLRQPLPWALAGLFGLWAAQRLADHWVMSWGPFVSATAPLVLLSLAVAFLSKRLGQPS